MRQETPTDTPLGAHPAQLRAQILGSVHISVGERLISDRDWTRRSARSLLLLLLATPGHRLSRERAVDFLWPDASPDAGLNALRVALHTVRRTLEPDLEPGSPSTYIDSDGGSVGLRSPGTLWVDIDDFEAAIARLSTAPNEARAEILCTVLSTYGGDLLAHEPESEWVEGRREKLRRAWRDAVLDLAAIDRKKGSLESVSWLQTVLEDDPSDETVHRALMQNYMAAGKRDEALRQYARCIEDLRRELDVEPVPETQALAAEIRLAPSITEPPVPPPFVGPIHNLPVAPNPLVGRTQELTTLEDLLLDPHVRLVTLTGPGGIGKTRLALEAARILAEEFSEGACFVDLSALTDSNLVIPTVLRAMGITEVPGIPTHQRFAQAVRDAEVLIVLDNFEQVVHAAVDVGTVIAGCPYVTILVTSREPLHLRAEHVVATPPLAVPPISMQDRLAIRSSDLVHRYDAVALFVERARAAWPKFVMTQLDESAIAAICARLDGLPLAIELAAARSRHLPPVQLLSQLTQRLSLLGDGAPDLPERQRTLRDAIRWSYDLLEVQERALFRHLAVFAGDFSLDAVEAMSRSSNPGIPVRAGVWALADKSLLQRKDDSNASEVRYRMLETIREFGLEQLISSGERQHILQQHAAWFLALAETAEPHLRGPDQVHWLELLDMDHDDLRMALEWACDNRDVDTALRLSGALAEFWRVKGYLGEGRAWLQRVLSMADDAPSRPRALCLRGAGLLAQAQGDSEEAIARIEQALADWKALGEKRRSGEAINLLADIARAHGDYDQAMKLNEDALLLFEEVDYRNGVADTLNQLGLISVDRADYSCARDLLDRSKALFDQLGDQHGSARVTNNLGILSFWQEDYAKAASLFERSLELWRMLGHRPHMAVVLANLGEALRAEGDLERAMAITYEGFQLSHDVGDKRSEATALFILGSLMQHHEYDPRAIEPLVNGLRLYWQVGDRLGMAWCLEALAGASTAKGQPSTGAKFLGAAEALREAVGAPIKPAEQSAYQRHLNDTRAAFSTPDEFRDSWGEGRSLTASELVDMAAVLQDNDGPMSG